MLGLLFFAADPAPDWAAGRRKVEDLDVHSVIEASNDAMPLWRTSDLDWELDDVFPELDEALAELQHIGFMESHSDAKEDALRWFEGL